MDENEKARAQADALRARSMSSADRSRFWAGLNTYLSVAARRENALAASETEERDRPS